MEQQLKSFTTFEELDDFITTNTVPEDLVPLALERLVDLTAFALEVCLLLFILFRLFFDENFVMFSLRVADDSCKN